MTQPDGTATSLPAAGMIVGGLLMLALIATLVGPGPFAVPLAIMALSLPGYALIRLLRLSDPALGILLGMVLSTSLLGLTALLQLALDAWDPRATMGALLVVGIGAAAVDVAIGLRGRSAVSAETSPPTRAEMAPDRPQAIAGPERLPEPEAPGATPIAQATPVPPNPPG